MDIRSALKGQYHAGYRMLHDCIELCPTELWDGGGFPRQYWRIAYHAAFYGHLYMGQGESAFQPWAKHQSGAEDLWAEDAAVMAPYEKADLLAYVAEVRALIDPTIDALDLDTADSGFPWYPNITKLEHEILSIRHVQGHVGQLSERLFAAGVETSWISRRG